MLTDAELIEEMLHRDHPAKGRHGLIAVFDGKIRFFHLEGDSMRLAQPLKTLSSSSNLSFYCIDQVKEKMIAL
jgi:hypothetical protein